MVHIFLHASIYRTQSFRWIYVYEQHSMRRRFVCVCVVLDTRHRIFARLQISQIDQNKKHTHTDWMAGWKQPYTLLRNNKNQRTEP